MEDGQMEDGQMEDGQMGRWIDGQMEDGQMEDGQTEDGQMEDGQMDRWIDGQMEDGQMEDGRVGRCSSEIDDKYTSSTHSLTCYIPYTLYYTPSLYYWKTDGNWPLTVTLYTIEYHSNTIHNRVSLYHGNSLTHILIALFSVLGDKFEG